MKTLSPLSKKSLLDYWKTVENIVGKDLEQYWSTHIPKNEWKKCEKKTIDCNKWREVKKKTVSSESTESTPPFLCRNCDDEELILDNVPTFRFIKKPPCVSSDKTGEDVINTAVIVYWNNEQDWYEGVILAYNNEEKKYLITYDDGDCYWEEVTKVKFMTLKEFKETKEKETSSKKRKKNDSDESFEEISVPVEKIRKKSSERKKSFDSKRSEDVDSLVKSKPFVLKDKEPKEKRTKTDNVDNNTIQILKNKFYPNSNEEFNLQSFCESVDTWRKQSFHLTQVITVLKSTINQQNDLIKNLIDVSQQNKN
eukprot:TRINITY_DN6902_c0_g1_i2.p2 TRINITY_DN6902_c0_g1~~TRINITY_DN6902_c0_g1_i2.p2  ORF type:complete len:310 (-),score=106.98 TRINITY_DN6902_c0_g1_i2:37-966(-)